MLGHGWRPNGASTGVQPSSTIKPRDSLAAAGVRRTEEIFMACQRFLPCDAFGRGPSRLALDIPQPVAPWVRSFDGLIV